MIDTTDSNRMMKIHGFGIRFVLSMAGLLLSANVAQSQQILKFDPPERRSIKIRDPSHLRTAALPELETPNTISTGMSRIEERLSLDDAIRIAVENAEIVRVIAGVSASTSGRSVYDVAISNAAIDVQNAAFDTTLDVTSTMRKTDQPSAVFDGLNPGQSLITGSSTDSINSTVSLRKHTFNGADVAFNINTTGSYFEPGITPLEPVYRSLVEMTWRQPLMRGYGRAANLTPVIVARIDTERSYFQFKDSVQELVRGVIQAYWSLVAARIELWARNQQIEQAEFAFRRASARKVEGLARAADVAQARSALANFRASLISARSNLLLRETALRNILGYKNSIEKEFVPTSVPVRDRVEIDWKKLIVLAEQQRPDIIELKLIQEADEQLLAQACNQTRPQLDSIAGYRWNGLEGRMPNGNNLRSDGGRFAGFNIGVNFSVPIGLRQSRATLRRRELLLARDKANLQQGIHQMVHQLTITYRNLDQFYEQISAFKEAKDAARLNFENQLGEFETERRDFINVLQAITDWGNAVSQEAQSVTQFNSELANIERQTGTILETHGIIFYEERYRSLGPMGRLGASECYTEKIVPTGASDRYPDSGKSSDEFFDLKDLNPNRRPGLEEPSRN